MLVALIVDAGVAVVVVEGVDVLHSQAHATGIVAGVLPEVGASVVFAPPQGEGLVQRVMPLDSNHFLINSLRKTAVIIAGSR